jgi:hypothetical protein
MNKIPEFALATSLDILEGKLTKTRSARCSCGPSLQRERLKSGRLTQSAWYQTTTGGRLLASRNWGGRWQTRPLDFEPEAFVSTYLPKRPIVVPNLQVFGQSTVSVLVPSITSHHIDAQVSLPSASTHPYGLVASSEA